jgi:hypothetical protein
MTSPICFSLSPSEQAARIRHYIQDVMPYQDVTISNYAGNCGDALCSMQHLNTAISSDLNNSTPKYTTSDNPLPGMSYELCQIVIAFNDHTYEEFLNSQDWKDFLIDLPLADQSQEADILRLQLVREWLKSQGIMNADNVFPCAGERLTDESFTLFDTLAQSVAPLHSTNPSSHLPALFNLTDAEYIAFLRSLLHPVRQPAPQS